MVETSADAAKENGRNTLEMKKTIGIHSPEYYLILRTLAQTTTKNGKPTRRTWSKDALVSQIYPKGGKYKTINEKKAAFDIVWAQMLVWLKGKEIYGLAVRQNEKYHLNPAYKETEGSIQMGGPKIVAKQRDCIS